MDPVKNVRYLDGAPDDWAPWLQPGDYVDIEWATDESPSPRGPIQGIVGVAVSNEGGSGVLRRKDIIACEVIEEGHPPRTSWRSPDGMRHRLDPDLSPLAFLTKLPRRALTQLTIELEDRRMVFDVSERHWSDESLITDAVLQSLVVVDRRNWVRIKDIYDWINVAQYQIPPTQSLEPGQILATLLGHPTYWSWYMTEEEISPRHHGPYRLEMIEPDSFDEIDNVMGAALLREWIANPGCDHDHQVVGDVEGVLELIERADRVFKLQDLGEDAFHDVGWIFSYPIVELVLIGPGRDLTVILASGD